MKIYFREMNFIEREGNSLIRRWNARRDYKRVIQMIRSQLFPYVQKTHPHIEWDERVIIEKLQKGIVFVYLSNGKLTGFIQARTDRISKKLWIEMLAVDRNRQRLGIGSKLLGFAEKWGREKGCITSSLFVNRVNDQGLRFYSKFGYKQDHYEPFIDCIVMQKTFPYSR